MYSLYVRVNAGGFHHRTAPDSDMLRAYHSVDGAD